MDDDRRRTGRRLVRRRAGPLAAVLVLAAGCGSSSPPAAQAPVAGSTGASAAPSGPKQVLSGLIDMQDISFHNVDGGEATFSMANVSQFPGVLGGIVVNVAWRTLEPTPGNRSLSAVDAALEQVRAYNSSNPAAPLGVKLRVWGASSAPDWAKSMGGAPVTIQRNPNGCPTGSCALTVGRWWSSDYIAAWRSLQAALAARYDADPLVRHVAVTSCSQQTDEPFIPTLDAASRAALVAAGYSDAAQQACLSGAVDDYAAWTHTLVDYTFDSFFPLSGPSDTAFASSVMASCRGKLGARCVLNNHSLGPAIATNDLSLYDALRSQGPPLNFQTAVPNTMGCLWTQTIALGVSLGAAGIEVWPAAKYQGFDTFTLPQMQQLASEFTRPIPVGTASPLPSPCSGFH